MPAASTFWTTSSTWRTPEGPAEPFFTTNVVNNSGIAWDDFHFQLGFGTGAAFVPVSAGFGLDFDTPNADPEPTSTVFPSSTTRRTLWTGPERR